MSYQKIMDSKWIFEMMTLCLLAKENKRGGLKKNVIVMSKSKIKNKPPFNENFKD